MWYFLISWIIRTFVSGKLLMSFSLNLIIILTCLKLLYLWLLGVFLENLEHTGFHVRGHLVDFVPVTKFKWVNISQLSYGVPDTDISTVLGAYGKIKTIRSEQYNSLYTGVRHVLMDLSADIPTRPRIADHWCSVHYKGQKKLCYCFCGGSC